MNCGWAGTIEQFKQLDVQFFVKQLLDHIYKTNANDSKITSQKKAWIDSFNKLQSLFNRFSNLDASLIFEYEILRGGGRRPDVLLLINGYLIVLECKSYNKFRLLNISKHPFICVISNIITRLFNNLTCKS